MQLRNLKEGHGNSSSESQDGNVPQAVAVPAEDEACQVIKVHPHSQVIKVHPHTVVTQLTLEAVLVQIASPLAGPEDGMQAIPSASSCLTCAPCRPGGDSAQQPACGKVASDRLPGWLDPWFLFF